MKRCDSDTLHLNLFCRFVDETRRIYFLSLFLLSAKKWRNSNARISVQVEITRNSCFDGVSFMNCTDSFELIKFYNKSEMLQWTWIHLFNSILLWLLWLFLLRHRTWIQNVSFVLFCWQNARFVKSTSFAAACTDTDRSKHKFATWKCSRLGIGAL